MNKTTGLLVFAVIAVIGLSVFVFSNKSEEKGLTSPTPSTAEVREAKLMYKDGTYDQVGSYTSPAGHEEVDVQLTLKDNVVVEANLIPKATHAISKAKQEGFAKEYKKKVVGKNIGDLHLGKIAGASLTPKGFNDAVEKIKAQAKS